MYLKRKKRNQIIDFGHFWIESRKRKKKTKLEKKKTRLIKDRIIRNIRTLFKQEEDYYKHKTISNFWNNNYIESESNGNKNKNLSLDKYLNKIEPYLRSIIIDLQNSDTWKIQLIIAVTFISSKNAEEEPVMHSRSENIEFTFDSVHLMYYEWHKVNFKCDSSYIDSPDWMKKKKAAINPKNTDEKCFQYTATIALHYEEVK